MDDRYRITGPLGGGAMAEVYRGTDLRHNTDVAIKILKEEVKDRSSYRDRFEREVLITSKVNHPCCIHKLDFGIREDGLPYQVMELVPGQSLADLLDKEERLPWQRALRILSQLLQALAVCGESGIIHRDVKPENILVFDRNGERDCLKLIDFGIAKLVGEAAEGHEKLTSVGLILGTPHYIAPEWVTSEDVDARADLYSASIMLFEMLTSAPPFLSEDRRELMKMHLQKEPPSLKECAPGGDFPPPLEALVRKGLEKNPDDRFANAREYLAAVEALMNPSPVKELAPTFAEPTPARSHTPPANQRMRTVAVKPLSEGRGISPLMVGIGVAILVGLVVTISMLDGGSETAAKEADAGQVVAVPMDAAPAVVVPDATPVTPITNEQVAPAVAAWTAAGLKPTAMDKTPSDELANGACRHGKVDSVRVLLCVAQFDPVPDNKAMRRSLTSEGKSRKWRGRIKRGDIHLRVESVRKKKKKTRRKIEAAFRDLDP